MFRQFLSILVIVTSLFSANPAKAVQLSQAFTRQILDDELTLLEDKDGAFDISAIVSRIDSFEKPKTLYFKYTTNTYWTKFSLENTTENSMTMNLEFTYPLLDHIDVYVLDSEYRIRSQISSGDSVSKEKLPMRFHNSVVPIEIPAKEKLTVVSRVKTTSRMSLNARIWSQKSFFNYAISTTALNCIYFGVVLALLLYNFSLFLSLREVAYLYYVLFIASTMLMLLSWGGFGGTYLWPAYPELTNSLILLGVIHSSTWASMFSRVFLNVRNVSTKVDRYLKFMFWLGVVISPLCAFIDMAIGLYIFAIHLTITAAILIPIAVYARLRGEHVANFYLAAWSSLLLSALYTSLSLFQSLESAFTMVQFSSAIESLLLSFGLGYRFNLLKKEKYLVEKNLNENLRAKLHSYQQLEKVFYAHQISLIKDGHPLEKTMPTDGGTAAVISFDIIDSSKMVHEETNVFLRNIFHRCYEAMMRNYDPVALTANAYRIKELGDGFLCSVGYPFKTPNEQRKSITAMNLVREFQKIFEEEVAKLDYPRPVYFGIGIALGDIKGFYPEMGAKEYDLFGNGIVLATRYEAMRKELFKSRKKSSIIIVQERFFFSLTDEYRQDFECLDLSTTDFKVRDDPSAERLYFIPVDDALSRSSRKTG